MAKWRGERRSLSPSGFWSDREWDSDLSRRSFRHTLRSLSPLTLSDLDFWDSRSLFKARKSPAWSCVGLSGLTDCSKISTSTLDSQKHRGSLGMTRWSSTSHLAPEGASRTHSSAEDFELRAALEESSMRRAELVQRLREARGHLDVQTDLLKTKGSQLQQSQSISNFLEMKHKQLSEAVSALEQDKEAAELSRFAESRHRGELHDKDQDLKNLEIQRITENAETQIKISALELIFGHKGLQSRQEVVSECSPEDLVSPKALLEESRRRAETLEKERDQALQKLHDFEPPQQKEIPPESKKQKPSGSDLVDPNQQRRLVTEQLKSLFREREQRGERSPVFPRRSGLVKNGVQNATSIKNWNAVDTLNHQGRKTQKLEQELQQGATKRSSSQISVSQWGSKRSEEEKHPTNLKNHSKTTQMSAVRDAMENLKEK
ncbi:uncharacterized protein LOC107752334 [Sinocyclocheilus rhinocerous]|uniref:uncharacterized protein LOC107752334 n=1 Tax=Sinocyclocheilus rhinocerous TaxID=307959 RepID=UPI0007B9125F|nr:PREDICTED: uncharacterized protein LOC107752334 [Sinocyclocheilus rhinocerous]